MLQLNLKNIFETRGIDKPYTFLMKHGFSHNTATKLVSNKKATMHLRYIETLCKILWCEPNDLFVWQPDKDTVIAKDHPIYAVSASAKKRSNIKNLLSQVSYKKLHELNDLLAEQLKDNPGESEP